MKILITGCAGFIGYSLCRKLLNSSTIKKIYGIDNVNSYYDIELKKTRLKLLKNKKFVFKKIDISNKSKLKIFFKKIDVDIVIHLAAQAGVRASIYKPSLYYKSNIVGFFNLIENCRINKINRVVYASTSSVYGNSKKYPTDENSNTSEPESFYAATKKINELIAYSYSKIYNIEMVGLRFFTVYGPYGRPDMAIYKFTKNILQNKKIEVFNMGKHYRDFTYIDDVIKAIVKILDKKFKEKHNIFNIASGKIIRLGDLISRIENVINKKAIIVYREKQMGDVIKTHGNIKKISNYIEYENLTSIDKGLKKYIEWIKKYER